MPVLEGCFDSFSPYWPDRARGLPKRPPLGERSDGRDEDGGAALVAYSRGLGRAILARSHVKNAQTSTTWGEERAVRNVCVASATRRRDVPLSRSRVCCGQQRGSVLVTCRSYRSSFFFSRKVSLTLSADRSLCLSTVDLINHNT